MIEKRLAIIILLTALPLFLLDRTAAGSPQKKHTIQVEIDDDNLADAETDLQEGNYAAAEPKLREALHEDPNSVQALFDLGVLLNATSRPVEAIDAYRKLVHLQPSSLDGNLNLALLLTNNGDSEAGRYLRICAKLNPRDAQKAQMERAWLMLAHVLASSDPAGALDAAQQAVALAPASVEPHLELGKIYLQFKQSTEAEQEYKNALAVDANSIMAIEALCHLYLQQNKLDDAEALLRRYLQLKPENGRVHRLLGEVLFTKGKKPEAEVEFNEALRLATDKATAAFELASLQFDQKHYDTAQATLLQALQFSPNNAPMHNLLGRTYLYKGEYQQALKEFVTAVNLNSSDDEALENLALAASQLKNYPLSLKALDARAKLATETPYTIFLRASALDAMQQYPQAINTYQKFIEMAGDRYPDETLKVQLRLKAIDALLHEKK